MPGEFGATEKSRKGVRRRRGFHDEGGQRKVQGRIPEGDTYRVCSVNHSLCRTLRDEAIPSAVRAVRGFDSDTRYFYRPTLQRRSSLSWPTGSKRRFVVDSPQVWNQPCTRKVLASCQHIMMWGQGECRSGYGREKHAAVSSWAGRRLLRVAKEVRV